MDVADAVVPSLAPVDLNVPPLAQWAQSARAQRGDDRERALLMLHASLTSLPPTAANAEAVVTLLESGAFDDLEARDGRVTREVAVEALMALGFPHALQLHPDQLDWLRGLQRSRRRTVYWRWFAAALAVADVAFWIYLWNPPYF